MMLGEQKVSNREERFTILRVLKLCRPPGGCRAGQL
jgi:hypothetical protein